ncbi:thiamine pyrophosphate-dependent dehydrogenase E1 component subunit alpha [Micromonospora sp. AKA38]|uniref:thiamine pyrophosphate-dependent dehydrogenase E1 component subunit alpha n=1 Tax=Micromonospora sp. AKA38 TaxID=2733861 RepID=UPI0022BCBFFC|nr:thiamine pyrophosphate-dependent dehydrogenase E1 component subunit alpha [Micromonospora sp. AKA38]GHJ15479.1 dehydrogenase [Micromonospora sp. AKA38]
MTAVAPSPLGDADLDAGLLIRRFEEELLRLYADGHLAGTTHTCLGQEHIPVALAPLLTGDFVFSNHRGHGHYLAHRADPHGLLAELLGRDGGVCRGHGGSQHLRRDGFLSTGVQGESLPAAVGVGLHLNRTGQDRIVAAYVGDGTWGEGAVYEALNMAALWRVPLLVVVEHNRIAQSTPTTAQLAGTIAGRVAGFGITVSESDSLDLNEVRAGAAPHVARVRATRQPHVLVQHTVRLGPHSKGDDSRDADELRELRRLDWLERYATAYPEQFSAADARARRRVADVSAEVLSRPLVSGGVG